jgi:Peptidase family M28
MKAGSLLLALFSLALACAPPAPAPEDVEPAIAIGRALETANLMPTVEALAAGHLSDTKVSCAGYGPLDLYPACELSRDAAVGFVMDAFARAGLAPRIVTTGTGAQTAKHVVAEWTGATRPAQVVLLAAHLDAFYAGADDNSSGVAVMLETARVLATHRFARTVRFVGFDLEERGDEGSAQFVREGHADDVVAAIVLETVGFASDAPDSQKPLTGFSWGSVGDFLAVAANEDSLPLAQRLLALNRVAGFTKIKAFAAGGSGAYPLTGALLRSDNGPLWLRGVPTLMWTDTANYRNPHYHKATDRPETLSPGFLGGVARATAAAVALYAEVSP